MYKETIEHFFCECFVVKTFWLQVVADWNLIFNTSVEVNNQNIILGYSCDNPKSNKDINLLLLFAKKYILMCRSNCSVLMLKNFKAFCRKQLEHYVDHKTTITDYEQNVLLFSNN